MLLLLRRSQGYVRSIMSTQFYHRCLKSGVVSELLNQCNFKSSSLLSSRLVQPTCVRYLHTSNVHQSEDHDRLVKVEQKGGVRTLTLNNVRKRNALSLAMLDCLYESLTSNLDRDLRVIVIQAEGKVFSAGHDLKELTSEQDLAHHQAVFVRCSEVMKLVQDLPVPVIASVRGLATAAGCQLVASCDIAIATDTARFATPGVSVGLFCSTPAVAVGRAVPRKVAMEMLLTGNPITADVALRHGLVSRIVPEQELDKEVSLLTSRICETSRPVVALGKRVFYKQIVMNRDSAYDLATDTMVDNLKLADAQEGIQAFIQKRHPTWTHSED